jgi:TonB-linked SusC/RagA family outer membrane protein
MKLITVLLIISTLQISAIGLSQDAALKLDSKTGTLAELIQAIETQSDFRIFYKTDQVDVHRNLILASADGTVASVLQDALAGTDISYQVMDRLIVLTTINSQQIKVTGTVSDGSTNEPLPGVNILVEGTGQGVITDANGAYSIIVPSASSVLIFSYVGYNSEKVDVAGRGNIDILLAPDVQSLEEVVVIGYGTRLKKDVTTSISTVNSKDIAKTVNSTAEYSMMGRMAGVQVSGATGDPLTRPTVRIRGVNTWGVADPLYVIDGIAVTETGAGADALADGRFGTLRGNINIMTLIDPNDIESISVLKDASAAAIYGVRAANGVILITTKQGKKGDKPFLEFNARYGTQKIPKFYDVMSTPDLIKFKEDAYIANSSIGSDQTKWSELNPASPNYIGENPADINWQKAIINSYAPTQEYNLRLSGGTERSAYSISGGYANSEGVLLGKNLERYSVATNLRSEINNWLRVGLNYRLAYVKGKDNTIEGFNLMNMSQMPTWQPIYDPNGYLGYASSVSVNPDGITGTPGKWSSDSKSNARGQLATVDDTYGELRNMGTSYIEIEPIQGLKLKGTISVDYFNRSTENFTDYDGWQFNYGAEQSKVKVYPNSVGSLSNNIASNVNIIKEFSVNYVKSLGDHHFDLLFNAMDQQYRFRSSLATGYAMTTKDKGPRFIGNMEDGNTNVQTDVARNALQGYLGRFSYSFRSRYYLDVTVRRDGSSKFSKDNQWGTFPGFSAAWRISDESFMPEIKQINDIRLRVAWGTLGNMEVRDMAWAYIVNPNPAYSWGHSNDGMGIYGPGAAITDMANPDLSWEKTTTANLGLDFTLFSNKLNGSVEYYNKLTNGIIQQIGLPPSLGYKNTPYVNLAEVRNKGIEVVLNYQGNLGEIKYNLGANITTVKNIVEKTYKNLRYTTTAGLVEEGYSIGYQRGYRFGGIYQTQEEADAREAAVADNSRGQNVVPGDAWFLDINGAPTGDYKYETPGADNKLDNYDQTFLWNTIAPYYYGIDLGLGYKGIDFSTLWTGVGGVYGQWDGLTGMGSRSNGTLESAKNSWTPGNHSSWLPRNVFGDPNNNLRSSDRNKKSRSYLRLQSIQVGYTLPKQAYKVLGNAVSNVRVYASANNILTITPWPGLNPDGADEMPYIINFGLSARF